MPIDYKEYHSKWSLISRLIRFKRAKNHCEWCGVENHKIIIRHKNGWEYVEENSIKSASLGGAKVTKVVLTVAHIDHDKANNKFDNLAALCQKCHLNHDLPHHINNRKYGRNWKRNQLKLEL